MKLSNVTLIAISHEAKLKDTIKAAKYCMSQIDFQSVKIITDTKSNDEEIDIIKDTDKIDETKYAAMCINRLNHFVETDYAMVFQWDGFVINKDLWKDKFLDYDYIGAPWFFPIENTVGNGGFSLRSKKFLEVSEKVEYTPKECTYYLDIQRQARPVAAPEDWFLCYHKYEHLKSEGIKFPDMQTAYEFSVEHPTPKKIYQRNILLSYNSFGFHGDFNTAAMRCLENV